MIILYTFIGIIGILALGLAFHAIYRFGYRKGGADLFSLFATSAFEQKVNMFQALIKNSKPGGTVFLGDSITQDYPLHEFYAQYHVYNRGIGGDQTTGVKKRLFESVYGLKPKKVILLIGTNDLVNEDRLSNADIAENIVNIHKEILDHNIDCKVLSILPVNPKMDAYTVSVRKNQDIDAINEILKKALNVDFIDINQSFKNGDGNLENKYSIEGLHLSYLGYKKLTSLLLKELET